MHKIGIYITGLLFTVQAHAENNMSALPPLQLQLGQAQGPEQTAVVLKILGMLTVLALAPSLLIMLTSFVRTVIVLSFLRQAIGTQVLPPNQLIIALAMFLTVFIMAPTWKGVHQDALGPYLENKITQGEALSRANSYIREFMFRQTRDKDIHLFVKLSKQETPKKRADVPTHLLIPAFMISELKTAFQISFMVYVPFLVIDMVVASVLMSMGMMMLPPVMISLPFKLILFVLVDGWQLIVGSLVASFG